MVFVKVKCWHYPHAGLSGDDAIGIVHLHQQVCSSRQRSSSMPGAGQGLGHLPVYDEESASADASGAMA